MSDPMSTSPTPDDTEARCPRDGQTLAWHLHAELDPYDQPRTNGEFTGCDWAGVADLDPSCADCGHLIGVHSHESGCMDSMTGGLLERDRLGFCPCQVTSVRLVADLARIVAEKVTAAQAEGDALRARVEALAAEWQRLWDEGQAARDEYGNRDGVMRVIGMGLVAKELRAALAPKAQS